MLRPLANFLNALVVVLACAIASVAFAQQTKSPLLGQTRDQLVAQLGEPKSNIRAGAREILFFEHVKVTTRNDVAVEVEPIVDEPPAPPPVRRAAPATAAAADTASATAGTSSDQTPAPPPANSQPGSGPAPASQDASKTPASETTPPAPKREPELSIKFIRSGGGSKSPSRPAAKTETPPATSRPAASMPTPSASTAATPAKPAPAATVPSSESSRPKAAPVVETAPTEAVAPTPEKSEAAAPAEEASAADEAQAKAALDAKKKAALRKRWWRFRRDTETEEEVSVFSTQTYVLAVIAIGGGAAFLWWQRNQRALALAATAVSQTPFQPASAAAADAAGMFSAEQLAKLSQKKFERLVASYYAKTGVVAELTHAAPDASVHIKIFWKGEPKPFAGVHCVVNPPALIGPLPLMKLADALTAADIRRGYVVTNGKFNVEARDVGEEKHFTLLSGDIFLEKINALPPAARSELLKETSAPEETPASASAPSALQA